MLYFSFCLESQSPDSVLLLEAVPAPETVLCFHFFLPLSTSQLFCSEAEELNHADLLPCTCFLAWNLRSLKPYGFRISLLISANHLSWNWSHSFLEFIYLLLCKIGISFFNLLWEISPYHMFSLLKRDSFPFLPFFSSFSSCLSLSHTFLPHIDLSWLMSASSFCVPIIALPQERRRVREMDFIVLICLNEVLSKEEFLSNK